MAIAERQRRQRHPTAIGNGGGSTVYSESRIALRDAFDDQATLIAAGRYDAFIGKRGNNFLDAFIADPLFSAICSQAQYEATVQLDDRDFKRQLRGTIFGAMAKVYVSSLDQRGVPVFGSIVSEMVVLRYPQARVIHNGFDSVGVEGKTVYDGYMLTPCNGDPQVSGFIESTLSVNWSTDARKLRQIASAPHVAKDLGKLAVKSPNVIVVSPTPDNRLMSKADQRGKESARCEWVPVSQDKILDEFMPFVYLDVRDVNGRSIEDLRREWSQGPVGRMVKTGEPSQALVGIKI